MSRSDLSSFVREKLGHEPNELHLFELALTHKSMGANEDYERRFGYIYIVCATGKTAEEMLELARKRLGNDPERELRVAADEQRKITELRLEKMVLS